MRGRRGDVWALGLLSLLGCGKPAQSAPAEGAQSTGSEQRVAPLPLPGFGGRLFDNWITELKIEFVPDDPSTAALDGKGGPFGNGTLPDAHGEPMKNSGHDYRLTRLFGWDLRGVEGIAAPERAGVECVLVPNVLTNTDPREVWIRRMTNGEDAIPKFGSVLSAEQIGAIVDFMLSVRDGVLPRPDDVFTLGENAPPGHYTLVEGGDASHGQHVYAQTCAHCHGADGAKFALSGGTHSVGSFVRKHAYEAWLKVLSGHPGSPMGAQLELTLTREQKADALRDLFAALCDRTRFPLGGASEADVPDWDPRCGSYLK